MELKKIKDNWLTEFTKQLNIGERKEVNNTFNYYFKEYQKAIEVFQSQNKITGFENLFKINDITNIYITTYVNIGLRFANWYAKNFEKFITKNINPNDYNDIWEQQFATVGSQVAGQRVVSVQGTAKKTLTTTLQKFMKDPEFMSLNERQAQRILRSRFNQISKYQAQRIIRTEATNAANFATLQSSTDIFGKEQMQKEWISALDERTRATHAAAHGQIVDFDKKFNVGGEMLNHAGDPAGSARNVVNCRCTVAPFPKPAAEAISEISNINIAPPLARQNPLIKPPNVPKPIAVPKPKIIDDIDSNRPKYYPKEIDELKQQGFLIDDEAMKITELLKSPIKIKLKQRGGSFARANTIEINIKQHKSKYMINNILVHEIGHTVHNQNLWANIGIGKVVVDKDVKILFDKLRKQLGHRQSFAIQREKLKPYRKLTDREELIKLKKVFPKTDSKDLLYQRLDVADFFGALTKNKVGMGHTTSYYTRRGLYGQYAEFIAHCFENYYHGNKVFKYYYPKIYKESIELVKKLINKKID